MNERDAAIATEDLRAAREILANGWCKGALERDGDYCMLGAIKLAVYGDAYAEIDDRILPASRPIRDAMIAAGFGASLAGFNNAPDTTHQDVLNLFDKALAELGGLG